MRSRSMRASVLLAVCVAVAIAGVKADLPIHCLNAQVAGDWEFSIDAAGVSAASVNDYSAVSCGYPQPDRNADHFTRPPQLVPASTLKVQLLEPNVAVDVASGAKGSWTMIYDEGFEVRINGRVFFAYNKYVPNKGTDLVSDKLPGYTSHCDETMVGWVHDAAGGNWGCWRGKQTRALNAWTKPTVTTADDGVDVAPVVSPTGLVEEFSRVLDRSTEEDEPRVFAEAEVVDSGADDDAYLLEEGVDAAPQDALARVVPHPRSAVSSALPEVDDSVLFEADQQFISQHNKNKKKTWTAKAHAQFEKKPVKHMLSMLGLKSYAKDHVGPGSKQLRQPIKDSRPDEEKYRGLPHHWDWTDRQGTSFDTEVRNQGSCGSCYAMAAMSAFEARYRIASRLAFRPTLSAQEVLSCSFTNQGCQGGYPFLVAKHATDFGLVESSCLPYAAKNDACKTSCSAERLRTTNYTYVGGYMGGCSEAAMMAEIYARGPVMVAFQAPPDLFYYSGGVYTGPSPKEEAQGVHGVNVWQQTNHAVVAVGWGVDKKSGMKYWKLKNTWGAKWGENGYFRIRRGTNECGVESMATKADVILPSSVTVPADAPDPWAAAAAAVEPPKRAFAELRQKARKSKAKGKKHRQQ